MTDMREAATGVMPATSLRVLMRAIVDYAGLFPPASLPLASAVGEYAKHREGPFAWVLGRFILPAARLDEFEDASHEDVPREGARSWALSALLGSDIEEDIARIEAFNARHRDARAGAVLVDTVEIKTHSTRDVERAAELLDRRFDTYMEVPVVEDPAELLSAIAQTRAKAKIRTGGVTPDAFPSSAQVARFIVRCLGHQVPFKATAGLHHPIRADYPLTYASDAPETTMFGFLNLLLAVAAMHAGLPEQSARAILDERDANAFQFDERGASWRGSSISREVLERARESVTAFGSCSFSEPIGDLRALGLL
jgi:hypothetical protein